MKALSTACVSLLLVAGCGGNNQVTAAPDVPNSVRAAAPLLSELSVPLPGLSPAQSVLGAGSLLGLAKTRMPADQFSQIAVAIPGADALVGEAVKQGLPADVNTAAELANFLGASGISPDSISRMVPVLAGAVVGKVSTDLLKGFLSAMQ